ncbi:MAG: response regulator transcription factor [Flavobacteriales bacterium]|nr:response regulator transcription factor [Flavobacteriales bacterium]
MEQVRILIADDHQMFIDGIKALLSGEERLAFVGEAANGAEALALLETLDQVDLLITDINMPGMSGVELTRVVKEKYPEVKVLVITMHDDREVVADILFAEAEGYILKNTGEEELLKAIDYILDGSTHYSKAVMKIMMQEFREKAAQHEATSELTSRELEIIRLIAEEYSTMEIADSLHISSRTVETHRKNIMQKTHSRTIVGLIKFAFRHHLVKI